MADKYEYWNPILEKLPEDQLRDLQLRKFKNMFRWAYDNSPFYRNLYRSTGIEPGDIKTLDDITKVPKTEKSMLREAQGKEPYPYGEILSVPLSQVTEYRQTSGTTGQPVYHPETWQDWEWSAESWAYCLYAQGYTDEDRAFLPFIYSLFIAFWAAHYALEKIGAEVIPGGGMNTEARILKIRELRPTALLATPTYVLGMADTARNKLGIDPRELNIKKITVAGEPGAGIPGTRKRMEDAWGAKVYDQAGATEIGHWGYDCQAQCGMHVNEALHLVEIEDIDTGELITSPGRKGKMIITTFDRYAHPCIRFDSKDIIEWGPRQCECGRTFRVLPGGVQGRADDITKVKGVLLAPTAIEEVVRDFVELSDEYEVSVTKVGDIDAIAIKVEILPGHESKLETIKMRLTEELRLKTNLRYDIECCSFGSLPRFEGKARRFKDLRKKEH
jgi:phenylacetate-CoA ligase